MSKENKIPLKSNKPKRASKIKEKLAVKDAAENIKSRGYKGRVL